MMTSSAPSSSRRWALGILATIAGGAGVLSTGVLDRSGMDAGDRTSRGRHDATLAASSVDGPDPREDYCTIERGLSSRIGVAAGEQVRVAVDRPSTDVQYREKLFTVVDVTDAAAETVGVEEPALSEIGASDGADGSVLARAPHHTFDARERANASDEYVEQVLNRDRSVAAGTAVLAPHGGFVEYNTGRQARHAAQSYDLVGWACYGFNEGGGAYDRWHVTSTELDPASFPALGTIADVGFDRALAFHGTSSGAVLVGGLAEDARDRVASKLRSAFTSAGSDVPVTVTTEGEQAAQDSDNLVNWITADGSSGVQIEQPFRIREDHHLLTAETAVEAMLER